MGGTAKYRDLPTQLRAEANRRISMARPEDRIAALALRQDATAVEAALARLDESRTVNPRRHL